MKLGGYEVKASRWPWQGYGWFGGSDKCKAMLNPHGARFGGGWNYKLGVMVGGNTVIFDLLFGSIRIDRRK